MSGDWMGTKPNREGRDWSYSKSQTFQQCPRKFYYSEYDSSEDVSQGEVTSSDAVHAAAIVGIAVHRSIASQIANWKEGETTSFRDAQEEAENWINSVWAERENWVIEARNGIEFQASTDQRLVGAARSHLRTFFQAIWPQFRNHEYVLHEKLESFDIEGNRVWVKVDLCTRDGMGNLVISDWKTGDSPVLEIDSLQLDVYALWGNNELEPNLDDIQVQLVHTRTGELSTTAPIPTQLEQTREKIVSECAEWAQKNDERRFPTDPGLEKCQSCRFLQICSDGQKSVFTEKSNHDLNQDR